jgi:large subunit ribosomal protein L3
MEIQGTFSTVRGIIRQHLDRHMNFVEKRLDLLVRYVNNTFPVRVTLCLKLKIIDTLAVLRKLQPSISGITLKNEELTMNTACGLLGKKLGMTQVFEPDGSKTCVTAIEVGPCTVVAKRTMDKDGYVALQLGYVDKKEHRVNRPQMGHFKKANVSPKRYLREFRVTQEVADSYEVGQEIDLSLFTNGDRIDIKGTSKGKGTAGVVKTYGFRGGRSTHGVHEAYRHGGSLGMCQTPGRVLKGHKMAGRHSNKTVTLQGMKIVRLFSGDNIIFVKGPVPGSRNSLVQIRPAIKG